MSKSIKLLVGIAVSALMLYLAFRDTDTEALGKAFAEVAWWPVIPFTAAWFLHFFLRSYRWRLLLPESSGPQPTIRQLFDSIILGSLATFLLPFRLGEFIRPLILTRWTSHSFTTAFVSVVIERFFDLSAVLVTFALIIPFLPTLPDWAVIGAYSLGTLAGMLLLFIVSACLIPGVVRRVLEITTEPFPEKLATFARKFGGDLITSASVVRTPSRLFSVVVLTTLVWLTAYLQFYALLFMFPHAPTFLLAFALGVFVALAVALPSAPGFVGVFQIGCVTACTLVGYPLPAAQALSLITHLLTYILFIVVGFWLLSKHGLSLGELKRAVQKRPEAHEAAI